MCAKDLRRVLEQVPDDVIICLPDGEEGALSVEDVRWMPQFNILYLSHYWPRLSKQACMRFDHSTGELLP